MNVSPDIFRHHVQLMAIESIKNHFPKDKVDQMQNYLKAERSLSTRSHKRYVTFPASKRPRTEEMSSQYVGEQPKMPDQYAQQMKTDNVEAVMPSNVVLVAPTQPTDQSVIMPVSMTPVNDMTII